LIFYIIQMVSDALTDTKNQLSVITTNLYCSSVVTLFFMKIHYTLKSIVECKEFVNVHRI
jgi:hypothetical protein